MYPTLNVYYCKIFCVNNITYVHTVCTCTYLFGVISENDGVDSFGCRHHQYRSIAQLTECQPYVGQEHIVQTCVHVHVHVYVYMHVYMYIVTFH